MQTHDDGSCSELVVYGCMDSEACNYNASANTDNGCVYADTYYDCDGNCLNDTDGDDVCDELEVLGCTVFNACNYNSEATEDDNLL